MQKTEYNLYEKVWLLISIVLMIVLNLVYSNSLGVSLLCELFIAICSLFCLVLASKGSKKTYYFGIVYLTGYVILAFFNKLYGETIINTLYFIPMQVVGLYSWGKNLQKGKDIIETRKLKVNQIILYTIAMITLTIIYRYMLLYIGGVQTWLDASTSAFTIVATIIMTLRYREHWLIWIVVNVLETIMWFNQSNITMTILWIAGIVNSVYGYIVWTNELEKVSDVKQVMS